MTAGKIKRAWKSGSVRGYNGDGISVTATYGVTDGQKVPEKVDLRFFDNSVRPRGPFSRLRSFPVTHEDWAAIPMPDPDGKFGEGINEGFTIVGHVRLEPGPAGVMVRLRLRWGHEQVHSEEGYIMRLGEVP